MTSQVDCDSSEPIRDDDDDDNGDDGDKVWSRNCSVVRQLSDDNDNGNDYYLLSSRKSDQDKSKNIVSFGIFYLLNYHCTSDDISFQN